MSAIFCRRKCSLRRQLPITDANCEDCIRKVLYSVVLYIHTTLYISNLKLLVSYIIIIIYKYKDVYTPEYLLTILVKIIKYAYCCLKILLSS